MENPMIGLYKQIKNITKQKLVLKHPQFPNGMLELGAGKTTSIPTPIWAVISRRYQDKIVSPDSPSFSMPEGKDKEKK